MSPEQQLVQTAHAALKLGTQLSSQANPDETYFTVIGVRDELAIAAVMKLLETFNFPYERFYEPDLPGITCIATYPIDEDKRDVLFAFNLLKF
jgi:hypothetical protein